MSKPLHVFQTFIRADIDRVWQAIVDPEFTRRYFFAQRLEATLEPGAPYRFIAPDGAESVAGTIEEVDPPNRLVMTWKVLYDPTMADEPPGRVEWELAPAGDGLTRVTTIHRDLGMSPATSESVGSGWPWVLGSLKSFVETGSGLPPHTAELASPDTSDGDDHRRHGVEANNSTWELLGRDSLSADETDDLLGRAYAAAYHWRRAAKRGPENSARASWLLSRVHSVLGHGELALHHAEGCLAVTASAALADFDLAYAHEAKARALACLGRLDEAAPELAAARAVEVADAEDRAIVESDLAAGPWYGLEPTARLERRDGRLVAVSETRVTDANVLAARDDGRVEKGE